MSNRCEQLVIDHRKDRGPGTRSAEEYKVEIAAAMDGYLEAMSNSDSVNMIILTVDVNRYTARVYNVVAEENQILHETDSRHSEFMRAAKNLREAFQWGGLEVSTVSPSQLLDLEKQWKAHNIKPRPILLSEYRYLRRFAEFRGTASHAADNEKQEFERCQDNT